MKQKRHSKKKTAAVFISCLLLFLLAVSTVFLIQQRHLNEEFDLLVTDNLASYTQGQRRQAHGVIEDIQSMLHGVAGLVESTKLSPREDWLQTFLTEMGHDTVFYKIDYLSIEELEAQAGPAEEDRRILKSLTNGESIVSNIRYSERMGGKYIFAVGEPVLVDGEVTGVMRTRMDASFLLQFTQRPDMFQNVRSLIVDGTGNILFSGVDQSAGYNTTGNLYTSMEAEGVPAETVAEIQRLMEAKDSASYSFNSNGKEYYMAADKLEYNDWRIVNFVRSPDVLVHSDAVLHGVLFTGIILIGLTALASCAAGFLLLRQKKKLDLEQQRYAVLSAFTDTLLFEYDCAADLLLFTPNALKCLELQELQIKSVLHNGGKNCLLHPDDRKVLTEVFQPASLGDEGKPHYTEARLKTADGAYCWFGCQYKYLLNSAGRLCKVVGKLVDITGQRDREQALMEQAQRDQLTDTYNKAGEQIIDSLLSASRKGIFFMIDLNHFKRVNDTYGHRAGDELLLRIASMLKVVFRSGDIVARVGGDEFVAFVPDTSDREVAKAKAALIKERMSTLLVGEGHPSGVSASIGIAIAPADGDSYQKLYQAADEAMYLIKKKSNHQGDYAFYQGGQS